MKVFLILATSILFTSLALAQRIDAYLSLSKFHIPEGDSYIETYISVNGNSVVFETVEKGFQATLSIETKFSQNDSIILESNYTLSSPIITDTTESKPSFLDQQRFPLPNGDYLFELTINDINTESPAVTIQQNVTINFNNNELLFSDVEWLESFSQSKEQNILTKSGYDLIPYPSNFFPENMNKLSFYQEIYNLNSVIKDDMFLLNYYIENADKNAKINQYNAVSRMQSQQANAVLGSFDISTLPSGNYNFVVQVRNRQNELIGETRSFFQRSNWKYTVQMSSDELETANSFVTLIENVDTLAEYIRSLRPISELTEIQFADNQLASANRDQMQRFFLGFWMKRDALNPEEAWNEYQKRVNEAEAKFGTRAMKGYQTDRGRVLLQYGYPNSTRHYDLMKGKPYELWHYYKIKNQSNIKFVFVNENPSTKIYRLQHSDAVGEPSDPTWRAKVDMIDLQDPSNLGGFGEPINTGFE